MQSSFKFEGQLVNEEVVLITRKHPLILLKPAFICVAILLLPLLLYVFMPVNSFILYTLVACLVISPLYGFITWHGWRKSLFILTDRRILLLTQNGLTHKEMAGSGLEHIHRVTHEVRGVLPTLGGYGTVTILTDDSQTALIISGVDQPFSIQQEILSTMMEDGYSQ